MAATEPTAETTEVAREPAGGTGPGAPPLPPGRAVELPGRGTTFVREVAGPPGAPTVLLLHGWMATADLNWWGCYAPLGQRHRVLALDHRGHGRGVRARGRVRLEDCADDAAALVDVLGAGPVIAVGYSLGGPVAQLLWRRHRRLVAGLVLCATSRTFVEWRGEAAWFAGVGALALGARVTPPALHRRLAARFTSPPGRSDAPWVRDQIAERDWAALLGVGSALGRFDARPWIGEVDVPTAVVVTTDDGVVAPARQRALAAAIPGAVVHEVGGPHAVGATDPERFVPVLLEAVAGVADRSRTGSAARRPARS